MMTSPLLKVMVIVWHLIAVLTLTSFPDESQVAVNWSELVNAHIPPWSVFIVYSLALPVGVTRRDKSPEAGQVIVRNAAANRPRNTSHQAHNHQVSPYGAYVVTDLVAPCELCVLLSRKWAEVLAARAQSAVAVGSHAVMTCLCG